MTIHRRVLLSLHLGLATVLLGLHQTDPGTEHGHLPGALNPALSDGEMASAVHAEAERVLQRSEERMRRFLVDASHELRTPLTSIRGFAELYRQGAVSEEDDVRRIMGSIEGEAMRMSSLVEDLLLLTRLDQELPSVSTRIVDMLAVTSDAVQEARAVEPGRPISLEIGGIDPPPLVNGDEGQLRQALAKLVSNALRHTLSGTPVSVGVETSLDQLTNDPVVMVFVADKGPGMADEHASRVFEPFYRIDPARSPTNSGTGLGLAIVSAVVAGHGGTAHLHTEPGSGSRFTMSLPLATQA